MRCSNLVLTPLIKVQIRSNYLTCHTWNMPINTSQNYIIFISAPYCWFTVNLRFMTVTASFCTAVAVARSCLFCIYVFDFALSTVAFSTRLCWKKSNCFWISLSVCKGHSKFQSPSLLAWCLQNTWCVFSIISCLKLVVKLVMKTMYSTDPWRIFRKTPMWIDIGHWQLLSENLFSSILWWFQPEHISFICLWKCHIGLDLYPWLLSCYLVGTRQE